MAEGPLPLGGGGQDFLPHKFTSQVVHSDVFTSPILALIIGKHHVTLAIKNRKTCVHIILFLKLWKTRQYIIDYAIQTGFKIIFS